MPEYLNSRNIDLEKLGFTGLPKNLSYFKFEVGCYDGDPQVAEITVKYSATTDDIQNIEEKKYRLVEVESYKHE